MNHLYWCAVSTLNGDGEMIKVSLDNHIPNEHRGHGKPFPKCAHKTLKRAGRKKKWFKPRRLTRKCLTSIAKSFALFRHQSQ